MTGSVPGAPRVAAVPVLPFLALFSASEEALQWGLDQGQRAWGALVRRTPLFPFDHTDYYAKTMGPKLWKCLAVFESFFDAAELAARKCQTLQWEAAYAKRHPGDVPRPLNLDPGYVTEAKLVLATTKDRDHRIYLDRGIFAEVTLAYRQGQWRPWPWTYADYRSESCLGFLDEVRAYLRARRRAE